MHYELLAYDHFNILFLGRTGFYYTRDIAERPMSSNQLKQSLHNYIHRLQTEEKVESLSNEQTRTFITSTEYAYLAFKNLFRMKRKEYEGRYLKSLAEYFNLSFTNLIELKRVDYCPGHLNYGVFLGPRVAVCKFDAEKIKEIQKYLRGQLIPVTAHQVNVLRARGAVFSTITFKQSEYSIITPPDKLNPINQANSERMNKAHETRKRKRTSSAGTRSSARIESKKKPRDEAEAAVEEEEKEEENEEENEEEEATDELAAKSTVETDTTSEEGDAEEELRLEPPRDKGRPADKVEQSFVISGIISFVNHACGKHGNLFAAKWNAGAITDSQSFAHQWQMVELQSNVKKGGELLIDYYSDDTNAPEYSSVLYESTDLSFTCGICGSR